VRRSSPAVAEVPPAVLEARSTMMEQLATVLYLYKGVPDVEFLLNPYETPLRCASTSLPVLQFHVVNTSSPTTGETIPTDISFLSACSDGVATPSAASRAGAATRSRECWGGYTQGFALPTPDLWDLAAPASQLLRLPACTYMRGMRVGDQHRVTRPS
jgi:hypothetical protein